MRPERPKFIPARVIAKYGFILVPGSEPLPAFVPEVGWGTSYPEFQSSSRPSVDDEVDSLFLRQFGALPFREENTHEEGSEFRLDHLEIRYSVAEYICYGGRMETDEAYIKKWQELDKEKDKGGKNKSELLYQERCRNKEGKLNR